MSIAKRLQHIPLDTLSPRERARVRVSALRTAQTDAESLLWYHLRNRRFMGLKFRRQHPIGSYIADFYCDAHRLVLEIDGGQHAEQMAYDQKRSLWLTSQGIATLRFWNHEVLQHTAAVLEQLRLWLLAHPSLTPTPLPQGEG